MKEFAELISGDTLKLESSDISKYELGKVKPSTNFYYALIKKMGINVNWLITGEGEMYINKCSGDKELKAEIERLKDENINAKKILADEIIKYIQTTLLKGQKRRKK